MKTPRIYLDTSVLGGCFDPEFSVQRPSCRLSEWSFYRGIRQFNAANMEQGYEALAIHSPREVTTYGTETDPSG